MLKQTQEHTQALRIPGYTHGGLHMPTLWIIAGESPNPGFRFKVDGSTQLLTFNPENAGRSKINYKHPAETSSLPSWELPLPSELNTAVE